MTRLRPGMPNEPTKHANALAMHEVVRRKNTAVRKSILGGAIVPGAAYVDLTARVVASGGNQTSFNILSARSCSVFKN